MKILTQEEGLAFYWLLKSGLGEPTTWRFSDFCNKTGLHWIGVVELLDIYQKAEAIRITDFHISKFFYLFAHNRSSKGKDKSFEQASEASQLYKHLSAEQIKTLDETETLYIPFDSAWLNEIFWGIDFGLSDGMRFKMEVVDLTYFDKLINKFCAQYKQDLIADSTDVRETEYFAYDRQRWDVSNCLKQLIKTGHKKTALSISAWQIMAEVVTHEMNHSRHYNLLPTLFTMEYEGLLVIQNIVFPDKGDEWDGGGVKVTVKVNPMWEAWFRQEENNKANTVELSYQEFRFAEGVLFRDGVNEVVIFREKTLERDIMEVAFMQDFGERLNFDLFDIEAKGDKKGKIIYDSVRRINEKISKKFKFKQQNFFAVNHSENALYRAVK